MEKLREEAIKILEGNFDSAIDRALDKWGRTRSKIDEKMIEHLTEQKKKAVKRFEEFSGDLNRLLSGAKKNDSTILLEKSFKKVREH